MRMVVEHFSSRMSSFLVGIHFSTSIFLRNLIVMTFLVLHIWHSCQNISFGWQANVLHGGSPGSVRPGVIYIIVAEICVANFLLIWLRLAPLPYGSKCCLALWGLASPWSFSLSSSLSITTSSWPIVFTISSTPWGKHHVWLNWGLESLVSRSELPWSKCSSTWGADSRCYERVSNFSAEQVSVHIWSVLIIFTPQN